MIDPHGSSDQVEFATYSESKLGIWTAFPLSAPSKTGVHSNAFHVEHQQLDATIEKNANLIGKASTSLISLSDGLRVVPLALFPALRVDSVKGVDGVPLAFIQEDKNEDSDFAVILPKALAAGEKYTFTTTYSGKGAISNEGGGNYFPIARMDWYPNYPSANLGEYTAYDMTFRIPKGMKIAATGDLVSETNEGGENVTVWRTAQTVAGFNFGKFNSGVSEAYEPDTW